MDKPGWIKLHRKIQDCFLWDEQPYDRARAWIDLLLSAMHSDKKTILDGKVVIICKGSFVTSIVKLSGRWGWCRKKVSSFLEMLEDEQMICTSRTAKWTTVTIVNYGLYQSEVTAGGTAEVTPEVTAEVTAGVTPEVTADGAQKKNLKNDKNINNNTMCKADALALFEKLWQLYPVKKGKGQVSLTAKMRLLKVGCDEMARAIDRYKAELEKDSGWRKPQNGSTFFNSGYVDYLDANYVPDKIKPQGSKTNMFNSFMQRDYDAGSLGDLERKLLAK